MLGLFLVGLAGILLCSQIAYRSPEWKHYREVDRYRVKLFDYYGYPSYDKNEAYFTEHGIDRASYEAVSNLHMYAGRDLSTEQWSAMVTLAEGIYQQEHPLGERLSNVFPLWGKWLADEEIKPINQIVMLFYVMCLCLVLVNKSRKGSLLLAGVLVARMICWVALVYRGRFPDRIAMSLFWMEFAVLTGIILQMLRVQNDGNVKNNSKHINGGVVAGILGMLILLLAYCGTEELYRISHAYDENQQESWDALKSYCDGHEDKLYIWSGGSNTLYYYYDTPFDRELTQYENYIPLSSGHMMNPNTTEKLEQWGISDLMDAIVTDERVYLIFEQGKFDEDNSLAAYYRELYDTFYYEQVDMFEAGDVQYLVYRFGI